LEDDLQAPASDSLPYQLEALAVPLVSTYLKIAEETFHRLFESYVMPAELIATKIILEVGRRKLTPLHHHSLTFKTARFNVDQNLRSWRVNAVVRCGVV
jgi:hypothetical protein